MATSAAFVVCGSTQIRVGRVRAGQPVEHPFPQHRLGLGQVVPIEDDHVGVIEVAVRTRLAVVSDPGRSPGGVIVPSFFGDGAAC